NPRPPCGGRLHSLRRGLLLLQFQPTPSLRRATSSRAGAGRPSPHFNPRPPCGGRRRRRRIPTVVQLKFQPTPSLRRATQALRVPPEPKAFQPTPSLRRATALRQRRHYPPPPFQPTPSLRRATVSLFVFFPL